MKNLTLSLGRLAVVLAATLSLGACSRADYATSQRSAATLGSTPIASQRQTTPYVGVAAEQTAVVTAPALPSAAPVTATPSAPTEVAAAPVAPIAAAPVAKSAATPQPKLNLVQRLALRKVAKKLDKLTAKAPQFKQRDASAARGGLDGNLRSAILFGLVGLIVLLFSGVSAVFGIVGTILLIIGLVFLVLWLLDQA